MTRLEFAGCMARLVAAYRESLTEATIEVYYEHLVHYAPEVLEPAVREVIEDQPRFPSIAELLRYVRRVHDRLAPRALPRDVAVDMGPHYVPIWSRPEPLPPSAPPPSVSEEPSPDDPEAHHQVNLEKARDLLRRVFPNLNSSDLSDPK